MVSRAQFAETLRAKRRERGLSQEELVERIGAVDGSIISKWENGKHFPHKSVWKSLADALGCTVEELFGDNQQLSRASSDVPKEGSGIQWRVVYPLGHQFPLSDEVRTGITLLESILQGKPSRFIDFNTYSEDTLRRYARVAITSRTFQLVSVPTDDDLERKLMEKYASSGLQRCHVAKIDFYDPNWVEDTLVVEVVAYLAATAVIHTLEETARQRLTIGFSGGSTLQRLVELLPSAHPLLMKQKYVPLLATPAHLGSEVLPLLASSVVARLVYNQPGSEAELPFLETHQRAEEYRAVSETERKTIHIAAQVLEQAKSADMAFVSVGKRSQNFRSLPHQLGFPAFTDVTAQMATKDTKAYIGDVLLYLVDRYGQRVGTPDDQARNDALVYSIELGGLQHIARRGLVWILAASPQKSAVVHAALTARYANALVIDSETAKALWNEP
jgi:DNA-binding transcriptional regulator LsrR (DeoR family)/transcriptional regulator with XRE-family HTH domain